MTEFISCQPAETEALGETWGRDAKSGLVIALTGDLGAGKTCLVKGIARGLGISARVHSPTFTLVNVYSGGRLTLFHLDLYRLETPERIRAAGLEEYLAPSGVAVIEWADRWFVESDGGARIQPAKCIRRVALEIISERERRIIYEDSRACILVTATERCDWRQLRGSPRKCGA